MNSIRKKWLACLLSLFGAAASAQTAGFANIHPQPSHPLAKAHRRRPSIYDYLASDDGRAWLQVSGNAKSALLNRHYGPPSAAAVARAETRLQQLKSQAQQPEPQQAAGSSSCSSKPGVRFNLEPRVNAVPQIEPAADFILNGAGPGADLIVQTATDARGDATGINWDGSLSGYYVHTSKTADCSVQFEGGLPAFSGTIGLGTISVVADPAHGAFFAADNRFVYGGAIFRAATADLLNPAKCPLGTHTEAQAASCWMQTPPVQIDPTYQGSIDPILAVDERSSGTGAGDVYLVGEAQSMFIVACTNSLQSCSAMENLDSSDGQAFAFAQVRSDGLITISYMVDSGENLIETANFITCTPAGAPNPPVCGKPVVVASTNQMYLDEPPNAPGTLLWSFAQHANRLESNGTFTTFLVYDGCTNVYTAPPPPNDPPTYCLASRVFMTFSTDNGQTWSTPVMVDNKNGFHYFPTITNDASTGTVSLVHYSTEGDYFQHDIRVVLNQILPGTTTLGAATPVTTFTSDTNSGTSGVLFAAFDLAMGAIAHGTGTAGQSHLYLSFDSISVNGSYNGKPVPDANNQIQLITY